MTQDNSYIRMKEAIEEFGKTRQTFYNYIHKWLISTKKIHNKLYLSVRDIRRVLWNYIGEQPILNKNSEIIEIGANNDMQLLKNQVEHLESKVKHIPNEFSMYAQQMNVENKHHNEISSAKLQGYIQNIQEYVDTTFVKLSHSLKKYKFAVGYLFTILLNTLIVLILI